MACSAQEDVVWLAYARGVEGKRGGVRRLCGFGQMVVVLGVRVAAVPRLQMDTRTGEQLTLWREKPENASVKTNSFSTTGTLFHTETFIKIQLGLQIILVSD